MRKHETLVYSHTKTVYIPEVGIFRDVCDVQFDNEQEALECEKMLAERQFIIGNRRIIKLDDAVRSLGKKYLTICDRKNGYYHLFRDSDGILFVRELDFDAILKRLWTDIEVIKDDIFVIENSELYAELKKQKQK